MIDILNKIKILDFTRLLPGPLATHMMTQMGAEVIKIEHPKRLDYVRFYGKQVDGASTLFHGLNHYKKLVQIDYQSEEGKSKVIELVGKVDVLIEQFRPGAMKSWGLDFVSLKKVNPKLVYVSLTGYGQHNQKREEAGHDINYMAMAGLLSLLKDENGKPMVPGYQLGDIGGGAYVVVMATLGGIIQKLQTGKGSHMDISMTKGLLPLITIPKNLEWSNMPHETFNTINGKTLVNYGIYQCADGKWISLGALEIKFWNNFCDCINKAGWKRNNELELSVLQFPKREVIDLFKQKKRDEWVDFFRGKDVCIAPVLEIEELDQEQYIQEIKGFETIKTANGSQLLTIALPFDKIQ